MCALRVERERILSGSDIQVMVGAVLHLSRAHPVEEESAATAPADQFTERVGSNKQCSGSRHDNQQQD